MTKILRKIGKLLLIVSGILAVIIISAILLGKSLLNRNNISFESFHYQVPNRIEITGLSVAPDTSLQVSVERIHVKWSWISFLKLRPKVYNLDIEGGKVRIHSTETADTSSISIPEFSILDVDFSNISLNFLTGQDSILLNLKSLHISEAGNKEDLYVDSISIVQTEFSYLYIPVESNASDTGSFDFKSIPGFSINQLEIIESKIAIDDRQNRQQVSDLDLRFSGLKSSDLFDFGIQRLDFIYQDTLDMNIVMDDGQLNEDFEAELKDLTINIPGVSLKIAELNAAVADELEVIVNLNPSYLSFGRLMQFYPDITIAIDKDIPGDSLIYIHGDLAVYSDSLLLDKLRLAYFDSTSIVANGVVNWGGDNADINLELNPFKTSQTNLYALLTEESYNEFFSWPNDVNGRVLMSSTPTSINIDGNLNTREGKLSAATIISTDSLSDFVFSLRLESDSILIDQVVSIVPDSIPYGQVDFFLSTSGEESKGNDALLIEVSSEKLMAFGKLLNGIDFSYSYDYRGDSLQASINDDSLQLKMAMFTPPEEGSNSFFEGEISDLYPASFLASLPEGEISAGFRGDFYTGENDFRAGITLISAELQNDTAKVSFPETDISVTGEDSSIYLLVLAEDKKIAEIKTGTVFPEFSLPLPEWFSQWPDTEFELNFGIDEELMAFLTGKPGSFEIADFQIVKDQKSWDAIGNLPLISFNDLTAENMAFEFNSNWEEFNGGFSVSRIYDPSIELTEFTAGLDYSEKQYRIDLSNIYTETGSLNHIALLIDELDKGYNLRFNEGEKFVIGDIEMQITKNRGLEFNDSLQLLYGDIAVGKGSTQLEAITDEDHIRFKIDSLNITSIIEYFAQIDYVEADLNAALTLNRQNSDIVWGGDILALGFEESVPLNLNLSGYNREDNLFAEVKLTHDELLAELELNKSGQSFKYYTNLEKFDLKFLQYIPGMTDELDVTGVITGSASGEIGEKISANGQFIAEGIDMKVPMVYTPITIEKDTLFLKNDELILNDFSVRDDAGNDLVLNGIVNYYPEPLFDFSIRSRKFKLLNSSDKNALVNGEVDATADLLVKGSLNDLNISGTLKTEPGARLNYLIRESFDLVDASQIVTFAEFDNENGEMELESAGDQMNINWNANIDISTTSIEILLNEITQEYIRLTGEGQLRLRRGQGLQPLVYGSFSSKSGSAFIIPPAIPDLYLNIENASISWNGSLDEPIIDLKGYKMVKASAKGLSPQFAESSLEDFKVVVSMDHASLSKLDIEFDLEGESADTRTFIESLPKDTRQSYAINLLVFGKIGSEEVSGNSIAADRITSKLNEIARRNLKNSDIQFTANTYQEGTVTGVSQTRTDLNYSLRQGFLNNRLSFSVGGSVGVYMEDLAEPPPANLLGNMQVDYIISEKPSLILRGSRKDVYHGIIDGNVTETSLGLNFQRTWPRFDDLLIIRLRKDEE